LRTVLGWSDIAGYLLQKPQEKIKEKKARKKTAEDKKKDKGR